MKRRIKNNGFSLTEVLMAAGILTIGFIMIAGVLPVGVKLTAMSTERTIAAVAADEALAKIRLLGIVDVDQWNQLAPQDIGIDPNTTPVEYFYVQGKITGDDFAYPSTDISPDVKKYFSSVICRYNELDSRDNGIFGDDSFQATVFVSRDMAAGAKFFYWDPIAQVYGADGDYPRPVPVPVRNEISGVGLIDSVIINVNDPLYDPAVLDFITDESVLVDGRTGQIMRVKERFKANPKQILLEDKLFDTDLLPDADPLSGAERYVWVVPPAVNSSRYPCVGIYQRNVKFK